MEPISRQIQGNLEETLTSKLRYRDPSPGYVSKLKSQLVTPAEVTISGQRAKLPVLGTAAGLIAFIAAVILLIRYIAGFFRED